MRKLLFMVFILCVVQLIASQNISIDEMPSDFFGSWYTTDGNNVWHLSITKDYFMVGNRMWKYLTISTLNDGFKIYTRCGSDYHYFFFKNIGKNYLEYSSNINSPFTLQKKKRDLPNIRQNNSNSRDIEKKSYQRGEFIYDVKFGSWWDIVDRDRDGYACYRQVSLSILIKCPPNADEFCWDRLHKNRGFFEIYFSEAGHNQWRLFYTSEVALMNETPSPFDCFYIGGLSNKGLEHGIYDFGVEIYDVNSQLKASFFDIEGLKSIKCETDKQDGR